MLGIGSHQGEQLQFHASHSQAMLKFIWAGQRVMAQRLPQACTLYKDRDNLINGAGGTDHGRGMAF